ncbi:e3 ubiquitin-protein ligase march1 [Quercus suber]|uniref:E3 ubiquitin-protein ligase march1 n=1 Tax=Quercus suber TaxID=58331 RepID=A0AAW0IS34_QUESU
MQLVSNDGHREGILESDPILRQAGSVESSSSCEITAIEGDCAVVNDDLQDLQLDEDCPLVNSDQHQCRICLDIGGEDLIAPCHCKGTQKYVHRSCLDNWRSTKEGFAFAHCTECRAVFILRANVPPDRWWLRLKFQFLVARDHAFIFIIVQLIVAFLGVLVYKFYGDELREIFSYRFGGFALRSMWSKTEKIIRMSRNLTPVMLQSSGCWAFINVEVYMSHLFSGFGFPVAGIISDVACEY